MFRCGAYAGDDNDRQNPGSLLPRIGLKTHVETFKQRLLRRAPIIIAMH